MKATWRRSSPRSLTSARRSAGDDLGLPGDPHVQVVPVRWPPDPSTVLAGRGVRRRLPQVRVDLVVGSLDLRRGRRPGARAPQPGAASPARAPSRGSQTTSTPAGRRQLAGRRRLSGTSTSAAPTASRRQVAPGCRRSAGSAVSSPTSSSRPAAPGANSMPAVRVAATRRQRHQPVADLRLRGPGRCPVRPPPSASCSTMSTTSRVSAPDPTDVAAPCRSACGRRSSSGRWSQVSQPGLVGPGRTTAAGRPRAGRSA